MKRTKIFVILTLVLCAVMAFSACKANNTAAATDTTAAPTDTTASGSTLSDEYAIGNVTLCATNTNDSDFMKGFSMQGTIGDLLGNENIFSAAMCYTTGNIDELKAFFATEQFSDPASFLAEVDALDLDGKVRNLADTRLEYLDGKVDDPIRFYSDAVDIINGTSLLQTAGEYHFYIVTMGYEGVLAIAEADKTFTMEQSAIDLAKDFASGFEKVVEATLLTDMDAASITQEQKIQAAQEHYAAEVGSLNLDLEVSVVYGNDETYPDDYEVTLTKDGQSAMAYVTVFFGGEVDTSAELYNVKLLSSDSSNTTYEMMKGFQLGFNANTELVTADNTQGYIMFYSTGDIEAVKAFLAGKTFADMEAMDEAGTVKLITDLSYADGAANTFYSDAKDLINNVSLIETSGDYHFYVATIAIADADVVRYIAEADQMCSIAID